MPDGFDAVVMREHVHYDERRARVELRAAAAPYQHVRSIGEDVSAAELLLPDGPSAAPRRRRRRRRGGRDRAAWCAARPVVAVIPTGDEIRPVGTEPAPGEILDTNSLMLAAQAEAAGCEAWRSPIVPDVPERDRGGGADAAAASGPRDRDRRLERGPRRPHRASVVERVGTLAVHGVAVRPGTPWCSAWSTGRRCWAPRLPGLRRADVRHLRRAAARRARGRPADRAAAARRPGSRASSPPSMGMDDWVRVRLGRVGGQLVATPLPRGAGRADLAGARRRPARGPRRRWRATTRASRSTVALLRGRRRDRAHDRRDRLARPRARPGRLGATRARPGVTLASSNVGSLGGLVALRDGLCHVAGSHLLDPETGEYTLPYLDRVPRRPRRRGRAAGAPRAGADRRARATRSAIAGIEDVARAGLRYVNRQRGAGTRMLLDHELRGRDRPGRAIDGYRREEHTHLAVAAAVAAGRADAGLGVLAAARAFGLDFVPVAREPYDLVLARTRSRPRPPHRCGRCSATRASEAPWRSSAATTRRRWAAVSAEAR